MEISGILPSAKDNQLKTKVLRIFEEIDATVLVEDCHRLPSKGTPKVILKLNLRKNLDPQTVNLLSGTKTYINESLYKYYQKLWSKCKKLCAKHMLLFRVSNRSI